jgi:hypothetical protein
MMQSPLRRFDFFTPRGKSSASKTREIAEQPDKRWISSAAPEARMA